MSVIMSRHMLMHMSPHMSLHMFMHMSIHMSVHVSIHTSMNMYTIHLFTTFSKKIVGIQMKKLTVHQHAKPAFADTGSDDEADDVP